MSKASDRYREAVVRRVLDGDGQAPPARRKAAYDHDASLVLLDKATRHAWKIGDDDVAAAKASGLSEDQIFELVICAAVGQAERQHASAIAALDAAEAELAVSRVKEKRS